MNKISLTQKAFDIIGFFLGWLSVVVQFVLIIQNRQVEVFETMIRFFSFFTILTNILVAVFFTSKVFNSLGNNLTIFNKKGAFTAITAFILIVGLVYQFVLRGIWEPKGAQMFVDEMLHTINPLFFFLYWLLFSTTQKIKFGEILIWLFYPLLYLAFVLIRGSLSDFYPYPFLNITAIGIGEVLINSLIILAFMLCVLAILVFINNKKSN